MNFPDSIYDDCYIPVYDNVLKDIYNKVEIGDIILIKSIRTNSKWEETEVIAKKVSKVYYDIVYNIATSKGVLRNYSDFKWRYEDLFECNKYLLRGYWNKRKEIKLA